MEKTLSDDRELAIGYEMWLDELEYRDLEGVAEVEEIRAMHEQELRFA